MRLYRSPFFYKLTTAKFFRRLNLRNNSRRVLLSRRQLILNILLHETSWYLSKEIFFEELIFLNASCMVQRVSPPQLYRVRSMHTYTIKKLCISVSLYSVSEAYSEPSQTPKMKHFSEIINVWKPFTIFTKSSFLDISLGF